MSARDELVEYVLTSPKPTRPSLSGLLAGVEREAVRGMSSVAIAKPGDTILVGFDHRLSDEEFEEMTARLRAVGDDLGIRFGVIEGASSIVVVRPELDANGAPMRRRETLEGYEQAGER